MTIDRLGPVDPVAKYNKTNKSARVSRRTPVDSVAVSEEARKQAALQQISDAVRSTPDVRMDRVEAVRARLQDPNYINDAVLDSVAGSIMDVFGI